MTLATELAGDRSVLSAEFVSLHIVQETNLECKRERASKR
jgi:hypothetical protein